MQLWPSRGISVILTPDTWISRQIWVTRLPIRRHSTISEHPRWARSRKTGCLQSRREEERDCSGCTVCSTRSFISCYMQRTDRPCCEECHSWDRSRDSTRQCLWKCDTTGNCLWDVPAARDTQHTAAFTAQPLAIRTNRQLEFKLGVFMKINQL